MRLLCSAEWDLPRSGKLEALPDWQTDFLEILRHQGRPVSDFDLEFSAIAAKVGMSINLCFSRYDKV